MFSSAKLQQVLTPYSLTNCACLHSFTVNFVILERVHSIIDMSYLMGPKACCEKLDQVVTVFLGKVF